MGNPRLPVNKRVLRLFNDDMIRRQRLPKDVREVLHDLCYAYPGMRDWKLENIISRAQDAMMKDNTKGKMGNVKAKK